MLLHVSLVVASGGVVIVLVRTRVQRIWPGTAVALFGYSLASTHLAPAINHGLTALASFL
jgi:hypothetical protein